jgi:hypothetical protein
MALENQEDNELSFDLEAYSHAPAIPLGTLKRLPYWRQCRVCRSRFGSARARDGYCRSCRQIIENRTCELDAILVAAVNASPGRQDAAMDQVRVSLVCDIPVEMGLACGWAGTQARYWPKTLPVLRKLLRELVERDLRHVWRDHCSPGRFGRAAQRRVRKHFEGLCKLPEPLQPESVKQHLKAVRYLEAQGITPRVYWFEDDLTPTLLHKRPRRLPSQRTASARAEIPLPVFEPL